MEQDDTSLLPQVRAANRGGQKGAAPPKPKLCPPKISSMPTQNPLLLRQSNFFWKATENWELSETIWRGDLFFFENFF